MSLFRSAFSPLVAALLLPLSAACPVTGGDDDDDDDAVSIPCEDSEHDGFAFWSTAFEDGAELPRDYECGMANPELVWANLPEGTAALALIFDDPTAGNYPHWAIYNIPVDACGLDAGISGRNVDNDIPGGASELDNGFGWEGYLGSCPMARNTYRWRLWALSAELEDPAAGSASAQYSALAAAADEVEIEMLEMSHVYGPSNGDGL